MIHMTSHNLLLRRHTAHRRIQYVLLLGVQLCCWSFAWGQAIHLVPQPKQMELTGGHVSAERAVLKVHRTVREQFPATVSNVEQLFGSGSANLPITVEIRGRGEDAFLPSNVRSALMRPDAYWIEAKRDAIRVVGADARGALHGLTTLEKLLNHGKGSVPLGHILDWPDHKIRALHLVLGGASPQQPSTPSSVVREMIGKARRMQFNTLILQLANSVQFKSMERIVRPSSPWTVAEFLSVVRFARENGLEVIPEIKLLTHQEKLLRQHYPDLMYNKFTYDPQKNETYATVLPMIDEVIDEMRPKAVHIGHDELAGWDPQKNLEAGETVLPPELFLMDVQRLHAHLKRRGVDTWMWGDMLLAPQEFPDMGPRQLHGAHGHAALRSKIPQDIVICDWHYRGLTFPSALAFAQAGHRVLGATWKRADNIRAFSRYVANMKMGGEGMIATTWHHVRREEWNLVDDIIKTSGEAFWNAR